MAAAKFACPACQVVLQLSQAPPPGAKIRCPKCQAVFAVRAPAPTPVIQAAVAVGGSSARLPAKGGGSSLKLRGNVPAGPPAAAAPGRSSMKMKAAPPPPPMDEVDEAYDEAPVRKPKKKKQNRETTLIAVFAGLGALLLVIVVVVVLVIMFRPASNDADQIKADFEKAQQRSRSQTRPAAASGTRPERVDTNPAPGTGMGGPSSEAPLPADVPDQPVANGGGSGDGNPFSNLNVGNLPARAPRDLDTLRFLPDRADTVMFADFDAVKATPAMADLLMNMFATPDLPATHPLAQIAKLLPPAKLDYVLSTVRFGNLAAAIASPSQAGSAAEFTTTLFHLRSKAEQNQLVRALKGEPGPQVEGFACHRLPMVEYAGAKFFGFLLIPDSDDRTVVVGLSLKDDAVPLVGSGGGLNSALQAVLTAVEPSHFWTATSLENFRPLLTMASVAAGANMPPELATELKPILAELPNARGFYVQARLVDSLMRATVALTFETQGPGGVMSTNLSSLWNGKLKPSVQAAGSTSKIAGDIARSLRVAVRGTAVNVSVQITTSSLASDYPMIAQALRGLPTMAGTLTAGASAGSPGPSGAEVPPSPGQTPPPSTMTEPMTPTTSGGGSRAKTAGRSRSNPSAPTGLEVNLRAPDIEGNDADGKRFKLSDYKGKIIVLDFWGYWCPPCRSMLPHERELVDKLQHEPFVFIGVNTDLRARYNQDKSTEPVSWRNFMDGQRGPIVQRYKVSAFPTLFLIDANFVIRHKFVGVPPSDVLDKAIDELLAELKGQ